MTSTMIDDLHVKRSIIDGVSPEVECFMTDMIDTTYYQAGGYPDFPYQAADTNQLRSLRSDVYSDALPSGFQQHFAVRFFTVSS